MKKWDISAGRWRNGTFAAICLCALLTGSCGRLKEMTETSHRMADSLIIRERTGMIPVLVPRTQAALRLNLADMAALTPGAVFTKTEGQATVALTRKDSIIYITGTCDSLQLIVETQSREIYHLRKELEQQKTEIVNPPGWWEQTKNNIFYIAVGMFIMLVIIFIKRIWKRKTQIRL